MTNTSEQDCTYSTVYGGEQWCDEHDSAYPCPGSATDQNDEQSDGE